MTVRHFALTLSLLFFWPPPSLADQELSPLPVNSSLLQGLGDTRYFKLASETLSRDFHLYVRLPEEYPQEITEKFAVIYLLDGGNLFPMLGSYHHYLRLGNELPPAIIVGIAYGSEYFREGNMRSTDYTAPAETRDYWGGADQFQNTLEKEILPFIESRFRADPEERFIFGHSLGGQFVLFSALTHPDLFQGHISSNPALHRNLPFFLQLHHVPVNTSEKTKLFIATSSDERPELIGPTNKLIHYWDGQEIKPWHLKTAILPGQTHLSAVPEAFRQGLSWIFETE